MILEEFSFERFHESKIRRSKRRLRRIFAFQNANGDRAPAADEDGERDRHAARSGSEDRLELRIGIAGVAREGKSR